MIVTITKQEFEKIGAIFQSNPSQDVVLLQKDEDVEISHFTNCLSVESNKILDSSSSVGIDA